MPFRSAAIITVALLHLFAATDLAEAQAQKGKLGGGAGFAFLKDPEINLGSTATFGGFFGRRFNDNVGIEGVESLEGAPPEKTANYRNLLASQKQWWPRLATR